MGRKPIFTYKKLYNKRNVSNETEWPRITNINVQMLVLDTGSTSDIRKHRAGK